jgi:hypothetical protein
MKLFSCYKHLPCFERVLFVKFLEAFNTSPIYCVILVSVLDLHVHILRPTIEFNIVELSMNGYLVFSVQFSPLVLSVSKHER